MLLFLSYIIIIIVNSIHKHVVSISVSFKYLIEYNNIIVCVLKSNRAIAKLLLNDLYKCVSTSLLITIVVSFFFSIKWSSHPYQFSSTQIPSSPRIWYWYASNLGSLLFAKCRNKMLYNKFLHFIPNTTSVFSYMIIWITNRILGGDIEKCMVEDKKE